MKRNYFRILAALLGGGLLAIAGAALGVSCLYLYVEPGLPSADAMRKVELQVPLRVYTRSGRLIAQIGEQRRIPVSYSQIPAIVKQGFLAAEDDRFFQHHGIDYPGVLRALFVNIVSGDRAQGASTITMQAARNMFLTLDKTWRRKVQEMFLTERMEREFTKEEIFGLYLNVIFFGQRSYGVAAAADTFFGKSLDQLTVAEAATLAGLPQAPSRYNPIVNPHLAQARRTYVLRRMTELHYIDPDTAARANAEPVVARTHAPRSDVEAPYVAEMARLEVRRRYGAAAESSGYRVFTTVDDRLQAAANRALRLGLLEYDRRHGWRGPTAHVDPEKPSGFVPALEEYSQIGVLVPAVVTRVDQKSAHVLIKQMGDAKIDWDGMSWARKPVRADVLGPEPKAASEIVAPGDIVYVITNGEGTAQLGQIPEAQAALVAMNPSDGSIAALVGGFDYFSNKYNRVTQAHRQPGSGFKPFLYSGALEDGFTPASVILDAPVVLDEAGLETAWRPENSGGNFRGPMRLREALVQSRNLVSIRILRQLGTSYAIDYASRFGFEKAAMPNNLTLALGTMQATPLEVATGYSVFANGGFKVSPYFIDRIIGPTGKEVLRAEPRIACPDCDIPPAPPVNETEAAKAVLTANRPGEPVAGSTASEIPLDPQQINSMHGQGFLPANEVAPRVISPQNDYLMRDMMSEVITHGTGRRALALGRPDIAGKTGTTNEARDVWFNGFTSDLVATTWVGFDQERSLGDSEEGARTALPIWIHFMREALRGVPVKRQTMPEGLVTMRISPTTGQLASAENPDAILETFDANHLPASAAVAGDGNLPAETPEERAASDAIF